MRVGEADKTKMEMNQYLTVTARRGKRQRRLKQEREIKEAVINEGDRLHGRKGSVTRSQAVNRHRKIKMKKIKKKIMM